MSAGVTVAVKVAVSPGTSRFNAVLFNVTAVAGFVAATTVTAQVAVKSPLVAVITVSPTATAVTTPAATVATASTEDDQVTVPRVKTLGTMLGVSVAVAPTTIVAVVLSNVIPVCKISTLFGVSVS